MSLERIDESSSPDRTDSATLQLFSCVAFCCLWRRKQQPPVKKNTPEELFDLYQAPDGFLGTYEDVLAYERAHGFVVEDAGLDTATKASQVDDFLVSLARDAELLNMFLSKLPRDFQEFLDSADFAVDCSERFDTLLMKHGGGVLLEPDNGKSNSNTPASKTLAEDGRGGRYDESKASEEFGLPLGTMGPVLLRLTKDGINWKDGAKPGTKPTRSQQDGESSSGPQRRRVEDSSVEVQQQHKEATIAGMHLTAHLCDRFLEIFDQDDNGVIDRREFYDVNRFFFTLAHLEDHLLNDDEEEEARERRSDSRSPSEQATGDGGERSRPAHVRVPWGEEDPCGIKI